MKPTVVIAGLGDSGTLTAIHLARSANIVGISTKPGLVSGQELGLRLARPDYWAGEYRHAFADFRALRGARTVHGEITGVRFAERELLVRLADGRVVVERYDVLVLATGVSNGFWRQPGLQTEAQVSAALAEHHERLAAARSVAIVGGGAAAVGTSIQVALRWPDKQVGLYFPGERALPAHHGRVWGHVARRLRAAGVTLHAGHRAVVPETELTSLGSGPIAWSTGQPDVDADVVVWAIGRVRPNTGFLPEGVLTDERFVRVDPDLRVPGVEAVFAVGDVAATDPLRTSARNSGHRLLAANIRAHLAGKPLRAYKAPTRRWGSVLGVQPDGLQVFDRAGRPFRFPRWSVDKILQPVIVRWAIYRGIRNDG